MLDRIRFFFRSLAGLVKVMVQLLYGIWHLSGIPKPMISIFGGARFSGNNYYSDLANKLAHFCMDNGISVLTGGGGGIMEAANCAVRNTRQERGKSIGIGVRNLKEARNVCLDDYFEMDQFFARKWLLTHYSAGFIIFPGGFGTLDELAEIITLIQTGFLQKVPILLLGKEYWAPLYTWLTDEVLSHGLIAKEDLELFIITDDLEEIFSCIKKHLLAQQSDIGDV